jgi:hypothetical protein
MKRFLAFLCAAVLLTACHNQAQDPVIKGYQIEQITGIGLNTEGVTTDMVLKLDVENPSAARYAIESLNAIVYKGAETARFAQVDMKEPVSIAPRSEQTVDLPLHVTLLRPLALLAGNSDGFDLSQYCADLDLVVRKGSLKKRIQRERVPLKDLEFLLSQFYETK